MFLGAVGGSSRKQACLWVDVIVCVAVSLGPACSGNRLLSTPPSDGGAPIGSDAEGTADPGGPEVIVANRGTIEDFVVCGHTLVWSEAGADHDAIVRVPRSGGTPEVVANAFATVLATDGAVAYWIDRNTWSIMSFPCGGVPATDVAAVAERQNGATQLFVRDAVAFWSGLGMIHRKRLPDGEVETLATTQGADLAMTTLDGRLYWGSAGQGNVKTLPVDVAATPAPLPRSVAVDQHNPIAIASLGGVVYWLNDSDGRLQSFADDGMGVVDVSGGMSQNPFALAVSPQAVYWTNECAECPLLGYVLRTRGRAGVPSGTPERMVDVFARGETGIGAVRASDGLVYWASGSAGGSLSRQAE